MGSNIWFSILETQRKYEKSWKMHTACLLFAQVASSNPLPVPVEAAGGSVVVESGPVVYDDGAAEEEDDEEEEPCVSAMDLMGHNG